MKALLADRIADPASALMAEAGIEVISDPTLSGDALSAAVSDAEILVVRSTPVSAETLRAGRLKLVIRAGAGFDTIDVETAAEMGIIVANCPGRNADAVAELAFGLILALDRHIPDNAADLRAGRWNKGRYSDAKGLRGSVLGLLGVGHTGRAMIPIARAFGMSVIAWSRSLDSSLASTLGVERRKSPIEIARDADIVSVHVALTPETRHLVNANMLGAMRQGAYLINTARAEVVDESALAAAVEAKGLRVGMDVFDGEPNGPSGYAVNPIFDLPGVIGTHHIGGATAQAHRAVAEDTARIAIEFATTGYAPNVVTK